MGRQEGLSGIFIEREKTAMLVKFVKEVGCRNMESVWHHADHNKANLAKRHLISSELRIPLQNVCCVLNEHTISVNSRG